MMTGEAITALEILGGFALATGVGLFAAYAYAVIDNLLNGE